MAKPSELTIPLDNPIIYKLTSWAQRSVPGLAQVAHRYCAEADRMHQEDRRLYAHVFCEDAPPWTICWARSSDELAPNSLAGVCLHEFGHLLAGNCADSVRAEEKADLAIQEVLDSFHVKLTYRGSNLLQWVDFGKLLKGIG